MVTTNPQVSIRLGAGQAGIGKTSYHVAMKQLHFKPYPPTLIVELNEDDFDRRSEFCEHDGAGPHYAIIIREWLDEHFPDRWIGRRGPYDWPARSPDLSPCDFFLWGYLKDTVFKKPLITIQELKQRIEEACEQIPEEMCRKHFLKANFSGNNQFPNNYV
ncbi:unnamed protein product [Rotaria sordida]|uniref:Uncharacterized protein n=1 Tax=Rotaria sordida TaxID=392033 RepID=A0A819LRA3_9BILA|nr:unnamed protein product [Rotaria sordida]